MKSWCLFSLLMYQHWKYVETLKDITNKTPRILKNPPFQILRHHRNMFFVLLSMSETAWIWSLQPSSTYACLRWLNWNQWFLYYFDKCDIISVYHRFYSMLFPAFQRDFIFPLRRHLRQRKNLMAATHIQKIENIIHPTAIFSLCCLNKLVKKKQKRTWTPLVL